MLAATRISKVIRRTAPRIFGLAVAGGVLVPVLGTACAAQAAPAQARQPDATARIQALLDNPVNGVVNLPSGTFTIRPVLRLQHGETIIGHGTTLKVAPRAGDYAAVLAGASPAADLSGLTVRGVTFDQNSPANPIGSVQALYRGKPRFVILVSKGTGVTIAGNRFLHTNNVDTIVTGSATSQVTVSGNTFTGVSLPWHDHSSVYTSGTGAMITNNTFTASHDIAAIEVHGEQAVVTGNKIRGYYHGINIVANGTTFRGNSITGALAPVDLWSTAAPGLHDVVITGNQLGRDLPGWARYLGGLGLPMPPAQATRQVVRDAASTFPLSAITVSGNRG